MTAYYYTTVRHRKAAQELGFRWKGRGKRRAHGCDCVSTCVGRVRVYGRR